MVEWIMSAIAHSSLYVQKARLVAVGLASAIAVVIAIAIAVVIAIAIAIGVATARVFEVVVP